MDQIAKGVPVHVEPLRQFPFSNQQFTSTQIHRTEIGADRVVAPLGSVLHPEEDGSLFVIAEDWIIPHPPVLQGISTIYTHSAPTAER